MTENIYKKNLRLHRYKNIDITSGHLERFLDALRIKNFSPKTIDVRRLGISAFLQYVSTKGISRLQDITEDDVDGYRIHLSSESSESNESSESSEPKLKVRTIENYLRSVAIFFTWLEEEQVIFINPTEKLQYPKLDKMLQPIPSEQEMEAVLSQPDTSKATGIRDIAILETMYASGARLNEVWLLTTLDVDLDNKTARLFGKGSKERIVPLTSVSIKWLRKYLKDSRPELLKDNKNTALWISRTGTGSRLSAVSIQKLVEKYVRQSGIKTHLSVHGIRRAFATHMLNHGCHPFELMELMGHSNLKSLSSYLKVSIQELKLMHSKSRVGQ